MGFGYNLIICSDMVFTGFPLLLFCFFFSFTLSFTSSTLFTFLFFSYILFFPFFLSFFSPAFLLFSSFLSAYDHRVSLHTHYITFLFFNFPVLDGYILATTSKYFF